MSNPVVAVIIGSNRHDSLNAQLAHGLTRMAENRLIFRFIAIDVLPIFNQDLEATRPASVVRFKADIAAADGLLFVTPEHNRSIPAVLKNAIDWGSRPRSQNVWARKIVAVAGASPGSHGAAAAQIHLRQILSTLGALVMGGEVYITLRPDLIEADGTVSDESLRTSLERFMGRFVELMHHPHHDQVAVA